MQEAVCVICLDSSSMECLQIVLSSCWHGGLKLERCGIEKLKLMVCVSILQIAILPCNSRLGGESQSHPPLTRLHALCSEHGAGGGTSGWAVGSAETSLAPEKELDPTNGSKEGLICTEHCNARPDLASLLCPSPSPPPSPAAARSPALLGDGSQLVITALVQGDHFLSRVGVPKRPMQSVIRDIQGTAQTQVYSQHLI
ncbi:hypothetical protein TcWFU_002630 [Taenia crassiceps]|uniref:Uncharacterized protein n=1 Tax=Taenia crassiceps TaxID=6207 RepID=A0ABR4QA50_9CEST